MAVDLIATRTRVSWGVWNKMERLLQVPVLYEVWYPCPLVLARGRLRCGLGGVGESARWRFYIHIPGSLGRFGDQKSWDVGLGMGVPRGSRRDFLRQMPSCFTQGLPITTGVSLPCERVGVTRENISNEAIGRRTTAAAV